MSVWTRRPGLRWLVPVAAAALVIGGGAAANAISSDDQPDLPPRTVAELLTDLQTTQISHFSGTMLQNADLGLPATPPRGGDGEADFGSLWSGSNTLRVWYDGPERVRLALLGTLNQCDVIRNGTDLWLWNSGENKASHRVLPEGMLTHPHPDRPGPTTPPEAAEQLLRELDPTTEVTTGDPIRVAERDAYQLVLEPRDEASMIDEVRLAIDAEHGIALGLQVFGQNQDPAFELRFTQISFERPDPEQFEFNPPPGAEVTEEELLPSLPVLGDSFPEVDTVGEGWTTVVVVRLPEDSEFAEDLAAARQLLGEGQGWSGSLFSVLITEDRVLLGAVTGERLAEVAAELDAAGEGE